MSTNAEEAGVRPVWVWGLPLAPLTFQQTLEKVDQLIKAGRPSYFITANLNYAMLTAQDARLQAVNQGAAFILADGMPLVWASRWRPERLPERVAGADLVPALCERAARQGHRVFFLGGPPGVAEEAARILRERWPQLQIVGTAAPPFRDLSAEESSRLLASIRDARPDLLFIAFGQPKGELWMAEHCRTLGVPVCVQIGGSFNFITGTVRRAPRWLQRLGGEWGYRLYREPRLALRYAQNARFLVSMVARDLFSLLRRRR
jgi:N-acetylglucosaminyldiphosphoundecaprenol N-acetyl-beta-D-mannosaminyltransferase